MTTRPPVSRPTGALRFAPAPPPRPSRSRSTFTAVGAATALLALVGGVPALLLLLAGPVRLPTELPDRSDLTATIGIEQVIAVLVVVTWLAWAQFVLCVLVEVAAALRGGVLARPVPLSGPSQRLARTLVASILLAGTLVAQVSAAQAAVLPGPTDLGSRPAIAASTVGSGTDLSVFTQDGTSDSDRGMSARQVSTQQAAAAGVTVRRGGQLPVDVELVALQTAGATLDAQELELDGLKVYEVKAPAGRHHDSLWAISERHLGDGRRYQEIYSLNEGRVQPDGRTLHLARLIQPGWRLVMPEDAVGVPRYVADRSSIAPAPRPTSNLNPVPAPVPEAGREVVPPGNPNRSENSGATAPDRAASPTAEPTQQATPSQPAAPTQAAPTQAAPTQVAPTQVAPTQVAVPVRPLAPSQQPVPARPPVVVGIPPDAETPPAGIGQNGRAAPGRAAPVADESANDPNSRLVGLELLGAGLLTAALLGTLLVIRRRRSITSTPPPEAVDAEVWLRAAADPDRGALLDLALRSLPRSCRDAGLPLPQAYGAVVDNEGLDLLLTMSHPSAPPPWSTTEEGLRWRLVYRDAPHLVADGESAYPLLASVGRDPQGRDALVNLGAAAGPVAVVGSPAMAAAVVRALALGLAGNPWSRGIEVLTSDLPPALPAIAVGRLTPCADARDLTDQLEQGSGRMPRTGPIQILTGGPAPGSRPERVAIYGAPLNGSTAARLQTLISRRTDLAVVVTGELPGASWRLMVDDAGNLICDELSLGVTANRLGDGSIERLHSLFLSASTTEPDGAGSPTRRPGGDAAVDTDRRAGVDDISWAQASVRVAVLGEVDVRAPGVVDPGRAPLAREIVAYLALHPAGVHPTVLASAVWPRGVTGDVRDATLAAVRNWLGTASDGTPRIQEGRDGRIRLSAEVPCDWDVLRTLIHRAETSSDPSRRRDLLVRALHLVRGPLVGGISHGTYTWLPRTDLERETKELIVTAADTLCGLFLEDGDQVALERAAASGLQAAPAAQHLWRHILRAEHALGGQVRLQAALEHLRFALTTSGVDLEAETQALIEHLTGVPLPSNHRVPR